MTRRTLEGLIFLALFTACIPAVNWIIQNVGTFCVPNGPCLIPVLPGALNPFDPGKVLMAPSSVLMVGLAFVFRDLVQRRLGFGYAALAVIVGAVLSAYLAPSTTETSIGQVLAPVLPEAITSLPVMSAKVDQLALASGVAFFFAEMADLLVYTPLQRNRLVLAVFASSIVGLIVDSMLFLQLAFGNLDFLWGQVVGKSWMVIFALPFIAWLRRRDERIGMEPA